MTVNEAIDALRPFSPEVPDNALHCIRQQWQQAAPILLQEIARQVDDPEAEEADALFLYAIYLCAEMRHPEAFPYFVRIARLPTLLLDQVMGDILTENFAQMLARTCNGRIQDLQDLVEDSALNEYARSAAIDALVVLVGENRLTKTELGNYCLELLSEKLERRPSLIWDSVIYATCVIGVPDALPLIEAAHIKGLAEEFELGGRAVIDRQSSNPTAGAILKSQIPFSSAEEEMKPFRSNWEKPQRDDKPKNLLAVLNERKPFLPSAQPAIGRNEPCPCASGRKFKKCCIDKPKESPPVLSINNRPVREEHRVANDWMRAGYDYLQKEDRSDAVECWKRCWDELLRIVPPALQDPGLAEKTGAFEGGDFLSNWLQDFETLLVELAKNDVSQARYALNYLNTVLRRFPKLSIDIANNMLVDLTRCQAMLGQQQQAVDALEEMVEKYPNHAQGYVALAEMYGYDADMLNMRPDPCRAIQYLQNALENAVDCRDYDVDYRIKDLALMQEIMEKPLLSV